MDRRTLGDYYSEKSNKPDDFNSVNNRENYRGNNLANKELQINQFQKLNNGKRDNNRANTDAVFNYNQSKFGENRGNFAPMNPWVDPQRQNSNSYPENNKFNNFQKGPYVQNQNQNDMFSTQPLNPNRVQFPNPNTDYDKFQFYNKEPEGESPRNLLKNSYSPTSSPLRRTYGMSSDPERRFNPNGLYDDNQNTDRNDYSSSNFFQNGKNRYSPERRANSGALYNDGLNILSEDNITMDENALSSKRRINNEALGSRSDIEILYAKERNLLLGSRSRSNSPLSGAGVPKRINMAALEGYDEVGRPRSRSNSPMNRRGFGPQPPPTIPNILDVMHDVSDEWVVSLTRDGSIRSISPGGRRPLIEGYDIRPTSNGNGYSNNNKATGGMNFDEQEVNRLSNELENARKVIQNLRREKEEMSSSFNKERYEFQGRLRALQEANDNLKRNQTAGSDNLNDNSNNKKKDARNLGPSSNSNYNDDLDKFSMQKKIESLTEEIRSLKENKTKNSHPEWEKQLVKKASSSSYDNDEILKKLKEENRVLKDKLGKQNNYSSSNDKDSKVNDYQWENPTVSTSPSFISEKEAALRKEIEEYKIEIDELKVYLNQKTKVSGQKSNTNNNNNSSKNPLLTDKSVQVTSQPSSGNNKNTNENSSNNPEVNNLKQKLFDSNEEIKKLKLQLKNTNQSANNTTTSNQNYSDFNKNSDHLKVFSFVWEGRVETVSLQKKLSQVAKSLEETRDKLSMFRTKTWAATEEMFVNSLREIESKKKNSNSQDSALVKVSILCDWELSDRKDIPQSLDTSVFSERQRSQSAKSFSRPRDNNNFENGNEIGGDVIRSDKSINSISIQLETENIAESVHPYGYNENIYQIVIAKDAMSKSQFNNGVALPKYVNSPRNSNKPKEFCEIFFDSKCCTNSENDYIRIYKDETYTSIWGEDRYYGNPTDGNWPGINGRAPLVIPASKFIVYFHSESSETANKTSRNRWGYRVFAKTCDSNRYIAVAKYKANGNRSLKMLAYDSSSPQGRPTSPVYDRKWVRSPTMRSNTSPRSRSRSPTFPASKKDSFSRLSINKQSAEFQTIGSPKPNAPNRPKTASSFSSNRNKINRNSNSRTQIDQSNFLDLSLPQMNPPFVIFPKAERFGPIQIQPNDSQEDLMLGSNL